MKTTSAAANKMLRKLNEEYKFLMDKGLESRCYTEVQDVEPIIPDFNLKKHTEQLNELTDKISRLKHAINVFNSTTVLPDNGFTIDEALVRMSFLTKEKERLGLLRKMPKKKLKESGFAVRKQAVEYEIANYDPDEADKMYNGVTDALQKLQLELDTINSTVKFEVNI